MRLIVLVVATLLACGCNHHSEIAGKWANGDKIYSFNRDKTFTFDSGEMEFGGGYKGRLRERGTYEFDGAVLTLHINKFSDGQDKPLKPQLTWQRFSFVRDEPKDGDRDGDLATMALLADDITNPQVLATRKMVANRGPDYENWFHLPSGAH